LPLALLLLLLLLLLAPPPASAVPAAFSRLPSARVTAMVPPTRDASITPPSRTTRAACERRARGEGSGLRRL
jgi:hypothetical protein